jgi:hypothetical protein
MSLWLAKDQRSNEVVALQNALNVRQKPVKPLVLDGIFGPLTGGAVKCQNLKADGIAGPQTLGCLFVLLAPGGGAGIQASIQYFDTEIVEHEWKNMVGDPTTTGTFRIAPHLITSTMWEFGQKYPSLDIFGGLRIEAKWKKEWHGRRGRAQQITLFAGLAFGTVIVGEKEAEGRFRMNWIGADGKFQLGLSAASAADTGIDAPQGGRGWRNRRSPNTSAG